MFDLSSFYNGPFRPHYPYFLFLSFGFALFEPKKRSKRTTKLVLSKGPLLRISKSGPGPSIEIKTSERVLQFYLFLVNFVTGSTFSEGKPASVSSNIRCSHLKYVKDLSLTSHGPRFQSSDTSHQLEESDAAGARDVDFKNLSSHLGRTAVHQSTHCFSQRFHQRLLCLSFHVSHA